MRTRTSVVIFATVGVVGGLIYGAATSDKGQGLKPQPYTAQQLADCRLHGNFTAVATPSRDGVVSVTITTTNPQDQANGRLAIELGGDRRHITWVAHRNLVVCDADAVLDPPGADTVSVTAFEGEYPAPDGSEIRRFTLHGRLT
ncbi:MAG TPA: hypothetical protein VMT30_06080 [Candidatus Saccharimonadia bacterium]|nr:hypothetical protein [Candidatus Saccharimonadia bacterium]